MLNEVKNREFIDIYRDYMEEKKLGPREIKKHLSCVSAYVVFFLGHQLDKPMKDGVRYEELNSYFGNYFIRKHSWSSPEAIVVCLYCLEKFYRLMLEKGFISEEEFEEYNHNVADSRDYWIEICKSIRSGSMKDFFA